MIVPLIFTACTSSTSETIAKPPHAGPRETTTTLPITTAPRPNPPNRHTQPLATASNSPPPPPSDVSANDKKPTDALAKHDCTPIPIEMPPRFTTVPPTANAIEMELGNVRADNYGRIQEVKPTRNLVVDLSAKGGGLPIGTNADMFIVLTRPDGEKFYRQIRAQSTREFRFQGCDPISANSCAGHNPNQVIEHIFTSQTIHFDSRRFPALLETGGIYRIELMSLDGLVKAQPLTVQVPDDPITTMFPDLCVAGFARNHLFLDEPEVTPGKTQPMKRVNRWAQFGHPGKDGAYQSDDPVVGVTLADERTPQEAFENIKRYYGYENMTTTSEYGPGIEGLTRNVAKTNEEYQQALWVNGARMIRVSANRTPKDRMQAIVAHFSKLYPPYIK